MDTWLEVPMSLLTYSELSVRLNIKRATLYSLVSRNEIPHIRITQRVVRFDPEVIDEWVHRSRSSDAAFEEGRS